jgi:hypothetical protein
MFKIQKTTYPFTEGRLRFENSNEDENSYTTITFNIESANFVKFIETPYFDIGIYQRRYYIGITKLWYLTPTGSTHYNLYIGIDKNAIEINSNDIIDKNSYAVSRIFKQLYYHNGFRTNSYNAPREAQTHYTTCGVKYSEDNDSTKAAFYHMKKLMGFYNNKNNDFITDEPISPYTFYGFNRYDYYRNDSFYAWKTEIPYGATLPIYIGMLASQAAASYKNWAMDTRHFGMCRYSSEGLIIETNRLATMQPSELGPNASNMMQILTRDELTTYCLTGLRDLDNGLENFFNQYHTNIPTDDDETEEEGPTARAIQNDVPATRRVGNRLVVEPIQARMQRINERANMEENETLVFSTGRAFLVTSREYLLLIPNQFLNQKIGFTASNPSISLKHDGIDLSIVNNIREIPMSHIVNNQIMILAYIPTAMRSIQNIITCVILPKDISIFAHHLSEDFWII